MAIRKLISTETYESRIAAFEKQIAEIEARLSAVIAGAILPADAADEIIVDGVKWVRVPAEKEEQQMSEYWAKEQLIEAHKCLTAMGVPDREIKRDPRTMKDDAEFSLGVPERIRWLQHNWAAKPKS